jgi:putative ABC transport system substrate-binding protein
MFDIRRRKFLTLLGGALASSLASPPAAPAQPVGKRYTLGLFSAGVGPESARYPAFWTPFFDALRELGWVEGKNVAVERRYAENEVERLPVLASELVRLNVDVIVGVGTLAPLAAKQATSTIPIVMTAAGDPVGSGLVASLARPGGNVTGMPPATSTKSSGAPTRLIFQFSSQPNSSWLSIARPLVARFNQFERI